MSGNDFSHRHLHTTVIFSRKWTIIDSYWLKWTTCSNLAWNCVKSLHNSSEVGVGIWSHSFLCEVCMFSPPVCGFALSTYRSFVPHSKIMHLMFIKDSGLYFRTQHKSTAKLIMHMGGVVFLYFLRLKKSVHLRHCGRQQSRLVCYPM